MQEIFLQQIKVMTELGKVLKNASELAEKSAVRKAIANNTAAEEADDGRHKAIERIESIILDMTQRHDELRSMEMLQLKTRQQVRGLVCRPFAIQIIY
jgi:hypothetical protein